VLYIQDYGRLAAAVSFLLGYENAQLEDDSDASSSEDEASPHPNIILSKVDVYKVIWTFPHCVSTRYYVFHLPLLIP
jgi:hypothetical protein